MPSSNYTNSRQIPSGEPHEFRCDYLTKCRQRARSLSQHVFGTWIATGPDSRAFGIQIMDWKPVRRIDCSSAVLRLMSKLQVIKPLSMRPRSRIRCVRRNRQGCVQDGLGQREFGADRFGADFPAIARRRMLLRTSSVCVGVRRVDSQVRGCGKLRRDSPKRALAAT